MNEHLSEIELAGYVDHLRQGKPAEPSTVRHLEDCFECRSAILDVAYLWPGYFTKKEQRSDPIKTRLFWPIAAALIPLIAIVGMYWFLQTPAADNNITVAAPPEVQSKSEPSGGTKDEPVAAKKSSKPARSTPSVWAANFVPDPTLDPFVGSTLRSEGLEIVSPKNDADHKADVMFHWNGVTGLTLVILNNRGTEIKRVPAKENATTISDLSPGLYYWKLENADEALFVGRFTVGKNP